MRRWIALLLFVLLLTGCQRPPMVLPTMFATGQVDPIAELSDNQRSNTVRLFYATDRLYDPTKPPPQNKPAWQDYTRLRSDRIDLGSVEVSFGNRDAWPKIASAMRGQPGGKTQRPTITTVQRYGAIDPHAHLKPHADQASQSKHSHDHADISNSASFIDALNETLQDSPGRSITIYIHGFNTGFKQATLTAAEYDLYTGGLGPFITYVWPSYDSLLEYSHDRDSARYTAAHARYLVRFLADQINAGKLNADTINLVAHSTGAEIVGTVLRELALITYQQPAAQRQARWRIGTVALISPDVSADVARERVLKADLAGMYRRLVIYSSTRDRALRWASGVLYRATRIGSIREEDFTDTDRAWLAHGHTIDIVDVESAPYHGFVNHSHHRYSPAVASDLILSLRTGLAPPSRGLVRGPNQVLWQFPTDYAQRVTHAATAAYRQSE